MIKLLFIAIVILNVSSATLHNVSIVYGDNEVKVGKIDVNESKRVDIQDDSVRVLFTLGKDKKDWLCTDLMSVRDTIKISDYLETFDVELLRE